MSAFSHPPHPSGSGGSCTWGAPGGKKTQDVKHARTKRDN